MKNKKATVLVYSLILVTLSLLMALVVLNNTVILQNEYNYNKLNTQLSQSVISKGKLSIKHNNYLNNNGSGFVDNISCPDNVTMSGTTLRTSTIITQLTGTGSDIFCLGSHSGGDFELLFNSDYTDIVSAQFSGNTSTIFPGTVRNVTFSDTDLTQMTFNESSFQKADTYDDDINSDNYNANSSGSVMYPGNIFDDDADGLQVLYGFISPNSGFNNIFWNNQEQTDYLTGLSSYTGAFRNIGTSTGVLYFDFDQSFSLRIVEFEKTMFDETNELVVLQEITGDTQSGAIGYLQSDLSLSSTKTGSEFSFDFITKNYAIFLKNYSDTAIFYRINGEDSSGNPFWLNPVVMDGLSSLKTLSYEVMKNDMGNYVYKQFEIIGEKQ